MSLKDVASKTRDAFLIPLAKLVPGTNAREDFSSVPDLAVSILAMGQLIPIVVNLSDDGKTATILDGERRYRAARYVNDHFKDEPNFKVIESLLCVSGAKITPQERILQQLEISDRTQPLQPMERAKAFKTLVDSGMTAVSIAKRIGKTPTYVHASLSLLEAPTEVQDAVRDHKMSKTAAEKVSKAKPEKRAAVMEKVRKGEKVKVKDMADGTPLSYPVLLKLIKRMEHYVRVAKGNVDRARWEGVKHGLEIAAGQHDYSAL
jgi:ParB/RepB/Spo0J family partition protein